MASTDAGVVPADVLLRPATAADAAAVTRVFLRTRRAAVPAMPPSVHPPEDVARHLAGRVAAGGVWVAERAGSVVAFMDLSDSWLDSLYVLPTSTGQGIGSALLDLAKTLAPDGFGLWVFATNAGARRFYRRHGLVEVERTDGSGNEEKAPDVRMAWKGDQPAS